MTWPLLLYGFVARLLSVFARAYLQKRVLRGKEDPQRFAEKLGHTDYPRPPGGVIWLHAASVGESLSLLELVRRLRAERPEKTILVTTGTLTSAKLMAKRLPDGALHQFAPLDIPAAIDRFLTYWRPELVIWTESEFWPNTLRSLKRRKVPVILVNGRLSGRSFRLWQWFPLTARILLRRLTVLLVQDAVTERRLQRLGAPKARLHITGSLKEGAAPLPHDAAAQKGLKSQMNGRPLWCAASTHPGEEKLVAAAHRSAQRSRPGLLLILVPRHPERGDDITADLRRQGWTVAQRSKDEPLSHDTEIYLADTLGELGLWYRIAPISFMGGSLVPIGGHNPFEPAALGSAVLHGPHIDNFAEAYARLSAADAVQAVSDAQDLARHLAEVLRPDRAAQLAARAWDLISEGAEATDLVFTEILRHMPPSEDMK